MIIFLFVIFLFLAPNITHAQIAITDYPPSIVIGDSFPVTFTFTPSSIGVSYHYKIVGDGVDVITLPNTGCSSSYNDCETFSVGDTNSITTTAYGKINTSTSSFNVKIRIAHSETHSTTTSSPITVTAISPTSTPTPTPTSIPTQSNTPTPSNTPTSTHTPTVTPFNTNTPTPTSEPIRITIDNLPSSASLGSTFSLRFIVNHATPNTDYYIKAYGGINDNYCLETQSGSSWYGFNSAWDNMPKFKSDAGGNINQLLFVRSKTDKEIGNYKVKVKIRDPETESEIKYITITKFVPSPTPTLVPTPTLNPTPTESLEEPTPEPLPTDTPEAIPDTVNILGLSDTKDLSPTISPSQNSKSKRGMIPIIFISVGAVFLLIPLVVSKIRGVQ